ncbi:Phospholipase A and acyltransferase 1 [Bulinus truncatus]|nr:Phospholipase A and acyltransferase 1 [Bulinus truncatus]
MEIFLNWHLDNLRRTSYFRKRNTTNIGIYNNRVLKGLRQGDAVKYRRRSSKIKYFHHAVYIGDKQVIHLNEEDGISRMEMLKAIVYSNKYVVRQDPALALVKDGTLKRNNDLNMIALPPNEIVANANRKLGQRGYNIFFKNCEHFVTWCRYSKAVSFQVRQAVMWYTMLTFKCLTELGFKCIF